MLDFSGGSGSDCDGDRGRDRIDPDKEQPSYKLPLKLKNRGRQPSCTFPLSHNYVSSGSFIRSPKSQYSSCFLI